MKDKFRWLLKTLAEKTRNSDYHLCVWAKQGEKESFEKCYAALGEDNLKLGNVTFWDVQEKYSVFLG